MLRILLALVIIAVIYFMNPLTKMDSTKLNEQKQSAVEQQVDAVQQQVNEAKRMAQQEYNEVEEE
ncbi:hypothetical protein IJ732_02710 [bacterium]|nr:hypothetical protein [bacterium]